MLKRTVTRGVVAASLAFVTIVGGAGVASAAQRPAIASVTFSGTAGPNQASPTITITGTQFGNRPPRGNDNSTTSCGPYAANGKLYGSKLYFQDNGNFEAGFGTPPTGDCVGIIVVSWSSTQVVLQFGNSYGGFDHWYLSNGDGFAISIKTALWGGTVSGLT